MILLHTEPPQSEVSVCAPWRANINRLALFQVERRKVKPDVEVLGTGKKNAFRLLVPLSYMIGNF